MNTRFLELENHDDETKRYVLNKLNQYIKELNSWYNKEKKAQSDFMSATHNGKKLKSYLKSSIDALEDFKEAASDYDKTYKPTPDEISKKAGEAHKERTERAHRIQLPPPNKNS